MLRRESSLILTFVLLICFTLVDLVTFVQGAPPMLEVWHKVKLGTLGVQFLALRLMESAFLVSLLLSATLLLMRSRWAIILGIAQLPVRILCGYSVLPTFALQGMLGGVGSPQVWFFVAIGFDFVRIAATVAILRSMKQESQAQLGLPFSFRRALVAGASVLVIALALDWTLRLRPGSQTGDSSSKTVESVLAEVDGQLFFIGHEPGRGVTPAIAISWQGGERPNSAGVDTLGFVHLESEGMHTAIGWQPACGAWNLEHLMDFELGLFSRPWSETFGSIAWTDKTIVPMDGGYRLRFVPVDSLGGPADFYTPVVRGFQVWVDSTGVPRQGFCELDMKLFGAQAILWFEFDDFRGRLRIHRIVSQIDMANVRIIPKLDLRYRERDGLVSLEGADFFIPLEQLSPTLGQLMGGEHVTRLRLLNAH